jgi:predicted  nucleic acid-binding Zn-ribbon protein
LATARKNLEDSQKRFNEAQKTVNEAEAVLVAAKAQFSKAEESLRTAITRRNAANEEYKRAFEAL